jgi:hypothetical protein
MTRFYVLKSPKDYQQTAVTDYLPVDPYNVGDALKCGLCRKSISMGSWLPPYRVELEVWGNEYGDIAFGVGNDLLVSERFARLFQQAKLTGLKNYNEIEIVEVISRGGSKLLLIPPKYYRVTVSRSRAAIDREASELEGYEKIVCKECREGGVKRIKRIIMERRTWTGEDVFIARGLAGTIITSESFYDFYVSNNINAGELIPAEEYSIDFGA